MTTTGQLEDEPLITMGEAAGIARVTAAAVVRWATRGKGGVRLDAVKLGRSMMTSRAALVRFGRRREAAGSLPNPPVADGPAQAADAARVKAALRRFDEAFARTAGAAGRVGG